MFKIISILFLLVLISCGSANKTNSNRKIMKNGKWQQKAVVVDGTADEWDKSYMEFNKPGASAYSITNDKDNLYIVLITFDEPTQLKILQGGMTLFIDPYGKKKEFVSIAFPLRAPVYELPDIEPSQQRLALNQTKAIALADADKFFVKGFKTGNGLWTLEDMNTAGIKVKIDFSTDQELIYEAAIPIKSFLREELIASGGRQLLIGFKIYGMTKPDMERNKRPLGNATSNATGIMAKLFENVTFWKKITVAEK